MRFAHVIEQVCHKPWLITPTMHASIRRLVESKLATNAEVAPEHWIEREMDGLVVQRRRMEINREGIATIHVFGVLGQGLSAVERACGASDTRDIRAELLQASESARGIFLDIESPGGMVNGTAETGNIVRQIASEMPVVAFSDSMVCSAAYWIASQADEIYGTESADFGSIGVYIPWIDDSAMLEGMGIKLEAIANEGATYKGLGFNPALTPEQRQLLQDMVDKMAADFKGAVNLKRQVPEEMMRGQTAYGEEALLMGLIDGIRSRESAMQRLLEML